MRLKNKAGKLRRIPMKKILAVVAGVMAISAMSYAANPASLILRVTPSVTRDVTLSTALIDLGSQALGATNIISTGVTVTNSGNVTSTLALRATNSANWAPAAAAGADAFNLRAIFNGVTAPAAAEFAADDDMTTVSQASTAARFSDGTESGVSVAAAATRSLYFKLDMPTSSSSAAQQDITVEVLAQ
jgi:hypothetical protein